MKYYCDYLHLEIFSFSSPPLLFFLVCWGIEFPRFRPDSVCQTLSTECTDLDGGPELRVEQPTQPAVVSAQQTAKRLAGGVLFDRWPGHRGRAVRDYCIAGGQQVAVRSGGDRLLRDIGRLADGVPDNVGHVSVRLPGV